MIDLTQQFNLTGESRVRFVSDLHLGHPGSTCSTPDHYSRVINGCDVLVVCGDFTETRDCPYREDAESQRKLFEGMCREAGVSLVVLEGNHDPGESVSIATMNQGQIIAFHGHQLFKYVAPWGREYLLHKRLAKQEAAKFPHADDDLEECLERSRTMSVFVKPVIKKLSKDKFDLIGFFKHACWPPTRPVRIIMAWLTMRMRVRRFTKAFFPRAEIVFYGHLHRRDDFTKNGKRYINLGASFKHAQGNMATVHGNSITIEPL